MRACACVRLMRYDAMRASASKLDGESGTDLLVHHVQILIVERREASQHLREREKGKEDKKNK